MASFTGVRAAPGQHADFGEGTWYSNNLLLSFGAYDGVAYHGCEAYSDQSPLLAAVWPALMQSRGSFLIEWDQNGYCTWASLTTGTDY